MLNKKAYILLELLVVVGIFSLLLINININYRQVNRNKAKLTLKTLLDDIYLARNMSILGHETNKIEFNAKNNEYILKNIESNRTLKKVKFNSEIYISEDNYNRKIQYDSNGIPRKGGNITLYNGNKKKYIIIHRPVVGTLRVEEVLYE